MQLAYVDQYFSSPTTLKTYVFNQVIQYLHNSNTKNFCPRPFLVELDLIMYDDFCHLLTGFIISCGVTAFLDAGANKVPLFPRWPCT